MAEIQIRVHEGSRRSLLPLFRLADESESEIQTYYEMGSVRVACERGLVIGLAHVEEADTLEIVNLAVVPERRGQGIGKRLIEEAARFSRLSNTRRLVVCTGAWETGNIIFYLKRGFRIFNLVQNFFTTAQGIRSGGPRPGAIRDDLMTVAVLRRPLNRRRRSSLVPVKPQ